MKPDSIMLNHFTKDGKHFIQEHTRWHWVYLCKCCFEHDWIPFHTDPDKVIAMIQFVQTTVPDINNMFVLSEMIASLSKKNPPPLIIMSYLDKEVLYRSYYAEQVSGGSHEA